MWVGARLDPHRLAHGVIVVRPRTVDDLKPAINNATNQCKCSTQKRNGRNDATCLRIVMGRHDRVHSRDVRFRRLDQRAGVQPPGLAPGRNRRRCIRIYDDGRCLGGAAMVLKTRAIRTGISPRQVPPGAECASRTGWRAAAAAIPDRLAISFCLRALYSAFCLTIVLTAAAISASVLPRTQPAAI